MGFAPSGDYWRALRRISSAYLFSPRSVAAAGPRRAAIGERMLRDLSAAPSGEVVMRRVLHAASLDHVMATVFGARYDAASPEGAELEEMVKEGYVRPARLVQLGRPPAVAQVAGPARRQEEVQEPGEQSEVFVARIIEEHRRKKKEAASGESVAGASSTSCWDWRARRSCRTPTLAEIL